MILFDISPISSSSPIGVAIAVGFFLVVAVIAFIVFKMVKRTVKMAVRMAIVAVMLVIAIVGSIAVWQFTKTTPAYERQTPPTKTNR
jgi:hypothetical protein